MKQKIPIAMMFDDNYAIPAAVAILSLLQNANPKYFYDLHILHSTVTQSHQVMLQQIVQKYQNAKLSFIDMQNKYQEFSSSMKYPKEILYKLCISSIFPNIDKIIVTDVDVVFLDDISTEFINFVSDEYFAAAKQVQETSHSPFSLNIQDKNHHFLIGAGYMIYNLKQMRLDHIEEKCLEYLQQNMPFLKYHDQEVLSQVCFPKIKLLHPKNMVLISWFLEGEYLFDFKYTASKAEFIEAKKHPVQLHYINCKWKPTSKKLKNYTGKPWVDPFCPKANIWYYYLAQTPFFEENFRKNLYITEEKVRRKKGKLKKIKDMFLSLIRR